MGRLGFSKHLVPIMFGKEPADEFTGLFRRPTDAVRRRQLFSSFFDETLYLAHHIGYKCG